MTKSRKTSLVELVPETETETSLQTPETDPSGPTEAAIARCHAVYDQTRAAFASVHGPETYDTYPAKKVVRVAYREAMPELSSRENIRAFIGCIAHAILIEAIREDTSARLLYAAQVALSSLPHESHHSMSLTTATKPTINWPLITDH